MQKFTRSQGTHTRHLRHQSRLKPQRYRGRAPALRPRDMNLRTHPLQGHSPLGDQPHQCRQFCFCDPIPRRQEDQAQDVSQAALLPGCLAYAAASSISAIFSYCRLGHRDAFVVRLGKELAGRLGATPDSSTPRTKSQSNTQASISRSGRRSHQYATEASAARCVSTSNCRGDSSHRYCRS